jgi:hypothetical protein
MTVIMLSALTWVLGSAVLGLAVGRTLRWADV